MAVAALIISILALLVSATGTSYVRRQAVAAEALNVREDKRDHDLRCPRIRVELVARPVPCLAVTNDGESLVSDVLVTFVRPLDDQKLPLLTYPAVGVDLGPGQTNRYALHMNRTSSRFIRTRVTCAGEDGRFEQEFDIRMDV